MHIVHTIIYILSSCPVSFATWSLQEGSVYLCMPNTGLIFGSEYMLIVLYMRTYARTVGVLSARQLTWACKSTISREKVKK